MFRLVQSSWFAGQTTILGLVIGMSLMVSLVIIGVGIYKYFRSEPF